jgi:catechol 2,3-dioxygenase-like lactoylglutathione lyase family enzyme
MAKAAYRHLVIDAGDLALMAEFWSRVLGLTAVSQGEEVLLRGPTPQHDVWIKKVPEPVSVKQRIHLDVHAGLVQDVLDLGASPSDLESFRWKVVHDPEGGELCVFERQEVPDYRLYEIVADCVDRYRMADWWADVLGASAGHEKEWSWVEGVPGMPFEAIVFQPVPEPKLVKNRIHWDVTAPALDPLLQGGATLVRGRDDELAWTMLADPEGNEFCVFSEE